MRKSRLSRIVVLVLAPGLFQSPEHVLGDEASPLRSYKSANGLANRGLCELAVAEYRKFLSGHGNHEKAPTARYGLGVCLYRLGRFDDAVDELSQLAGRPLTPFAAEIATVLGQCHLAQGRYPEFGVGWACENQARYDDGIRA